MIFPSFSPNCQQKSKQSPSNFRENTIWLFNIAMENPKNKWRVLARKTIYFYGRFHGYPSKTPPGGSLNFSSPGKIAQAQGTLRQRSKQHLLPRPKAQALLKCLDSVGISHCFTMGNGRFNDFKLYVYVCIYKYT